MFFKKPKRRKEVVIMDTYNDYLWCCMVFMSIWNDVDDADAIWHEYNGKCYMEFDIPCIGHRYDDMIKKFQNYGYDYVQVSDMGLLYHLKKREK